MKKSLRRSILGMTIPILLLLSLSLAVAGYRIYRADMLERYRSCAGDAVSFLARRADGDDLQACIETGNKSEAYHELQALVDDLKESCDLEFIYIIVPLREEPPDNVMDVLSAVSEYERTETPEKLTDLGNLTGDFYPAEVAALYLARMDHDPAVTYFRNDTEEFGKMYTAIRPLFNSAGEPIAVVCADIRIEDIQAAALRYAVSALALALVCSLLFLAVLNLWFEQRIVAPIRRLEKAAASFEERCRARTELSALVMDDPSIQTGDEIEALSRAVVSMVHDVRGYARDLLDKENELRRADRMARKDALTMVNNRFAYLEMLQALEAEDIGSYGVVMIDLDHLKAVNDACGHERGDEYIVGACRTLCEVFRRSPVYRIGGDEFIVLLRGEDYDEREALCETLRRRYRALAADESLPPWQRCSAAVGMSVRQAGDSVGDVLKRADRAMYDAKRAARS